MEAVKFLVQSIKRFNEMGTVVRSGSAMCKKMSSFIDSQNDLIIVELGAGDGAITEHILKAMSPKARLFIFEINDEMYEALTKLKDERIVLIHDGAQHMVDHLAKYHVTKVDTIISAIPFLVLPEELMEDILILVKNTIRPGGNFIQMHYALTIKKTYEKIFGNVKTFFVPLNIPPGYVFKCVVTKK